MPNILKGFRTFLLALATFLYGLLETLDPQLIAEAIGADNKALILLLIAAAIFALRLVTTTPPGRGS